MKIVIDIPKEVKNQLGFGMRYSDDIQAICEAIENSTPLTDILDKIIVEIKALSNANPSYWHSGDMVDRDDVLDIIDKYL